MITIFENTPYREDKNLVEAYNSFMQLLPDGAWALFRDADTLFLDSFYGSHIIECIKRYPQAKCFTAITNRIGNKHQLHAVYNGDDIGKHRSIAISLKQKYGTECTKIPSAPYMSGMLFVLNKDAWKQIGGFGKFAKQESLILGVDNELHRRLIQHNLPVMLMKGLYIYHWYRGGNIGKDRLKHLL